MQTRKKYVNYQLLHEGAWLDDEAEALKSMDPTLQTLYVRCGSRQFNPGMLYNCNEEVLLPNYILHNVLIIQAVTHTTSQTKHRLSIVPYKEVEDYQQTHQKHVISSAQEEQGDKNILQKQLQEENQCKQRSFNGQSTSEINVRSQQNNLLLNKDSNIIGESSTDYNFKVAVEQIHDDIISGLFYENLFEEEQFKNSNVDANKSQQNLGCQQKTLLKQENNSFHDHQCIVLKFQSTYQNRELDFSKLQLFNQQYSDNATHVVTSVSNNSYGYFVFSRAVGKSEQRYQVYNEMIQLLNVVINNTTNKEVVNLTEEEQAISAKLSCKFVGDFEIPEYPQNFTQVLNILGWLYQNKSTICAASVVAQLSPLKIFQQQIQHFSDSQQLQYCSSQQIPENFPQNQDTTNQNFDQIKAEIHNQLQGFDKVMNRCTQLLSNNVVKFFPSISDLINQFLLYCNSFKSQVSQVMLIDPCQARHLIKVASPFSVPSLEQWISHREKEMKIFEMYFKNLQKLEQVSLVQNSNDLDVFVQDLDYSFVICLAFKIATQDENYLSTLKTISFQIEQQQQQQQYNQFFGQFQLQEQMQGFPFSKSDIPWFQNKNIMAQSRQNIKNFISFVENNQNLEQTRFLVADLSHEDKTGGVSIILYENGLNLWGIELPPTPNNLLIKEDQQKATSNVLLEWSILRTQSIILCYTVQYLKLDNSNNESNTYTQRTDDATQSLIIQNLENNCTYKFRVRAECEFGSGEFSAHVQFATDDVHAKIDEKEVQNTSQDSLGMVLMALSRCIQKGSPNIYYLEGHDVYINAQYLKRVYIGDPVPEAKEKVLMVIGATGAGKTTLINGFINYMLGVQWNDTYRFKAITEKKKSQAHSQTSQVTAYTVNRMQGGLVPYNVTMVDTPGFGDTAGIQRDKEIVKQIKEFFAVQREHSISHVDGIGFVVQAALARLTATQEYIFDQMLSIFGKDVVKNIYIMVTFADGQHPPVMSAIRENNIPYKEMYKFNNSALFANNTSTNSFDENFWKLGQSQFFEFFDSFTQVDCVSLLLTKEVLEERDRLQVIIEGLQQQTDLCMGRMEVIRQERDIIEQFQAKIVANEGFSYTVDEEHWISVEIPAGTHVTNCLHCNSTCHYPCFIPDNDRKKNCWAMTNGECRICEHKCHWTQHKNTGERFEKILVQKIKTHEDLKRVYLDATDEKNSHEKMMQNCENQFIEAHAKWHLLVSDCRECINKLSQIALKPNPLTQIDYLRLLIQSEKRECKQGWMHRVDHLEKALKQTQFLQMVNCVDDIDEYIQLSKLQQKDGWQEELEMLQQVKQIVTHVDNMQKQRGIAGGVLAVFQAVKNVVTSPFRNKSDGGKQSQ